MEAVWIGTAFVVGLVFRELGLPPLVGFLAAGFVLGALGVEVEKGLEALAHAGVLLLLFVVGLKVRLQNVIRGEVWGTGLLHLALSGAALAAFLHLVLGLEAAAAALLGTALGFSSTVVAAKVLEEKRELRAFHGRVSIGILIIQDLVAVVLLVIAADLVPAPWAVALVALVFLRGLLGRLLVFSGHDELLVLFGLLLAIAVGGGAFSQAGLSAELGALLLGAMLAGHPRAEALGKALWSVKELFLVAFFLSIGMAGPPTWEGLGIAALLVLMLVLKVALFFVLLTRFRLRARSAFLTSMALATYSEFALIVAHVAVQNGVLPEPWLAHVALAVALSFALAAPLNRAAHVLWERYRVKLRRIERAERHPDDAPISLGNSQVAVMGMGRVGTGAYDFLREKGQRVVGLDSDPGKVEGHRAAGRRVVYADAEDPGLWERLNLDNVRAVLLAMPDLEAKTSAVLALRRRGYAGLISATNVYAEEAEAILSAGCTTTFNYFDEAGVGLAEHTLESLGDVRNVGAQASASPEGVAGS